MAKIIHSFVVISVTSGFKTTILYKKTPNRLSKVRLFDPWFLVSLNCHVHINDYPTLFVFPHNLAVSAALSVQGLAANAYSANY